MSTASVPRPQSSPPRQPRQRPSGSKSSSTIDPFRVLRRYMWLILFAAVFGTGIGVASHVLLGRYYPLYRSNVLFEIQSGVQDVREIGVNDIYQDQLVLRLAMTESLLLTSREVLENALRDRQVRQTSWFRGNFVTDQGQELVDDAVDELTESLKTGVVRNTNLFEVTWTSHNGKDIPVVLNAVARSYIDRRKALDDRMYNDNIRVFRDQLTDTQRQIQDLDQQIGTYIRNNQMSTLVDPKDSQTAYRMRMLTDRITAVEGELSQVESAYMQTAAKLEGSVEPTSEDFHRAGQDPQVASHVQAVLQIKTELRHLYEIYQPDHPLIARLESRLRATETERDAKMEEIMRSFLAASLKSMGDRRDQLRNELDALEEEFEAQGIQLRRLAANQSEYESMATQRNYLEASRDADLQLIKEVHLLQLRSDARRVRLAQQSLEPRDRAFPKLQIIVPLGALLMVGLTVGLVFLRELTEQRVRSASDLAMVSGARILGIIPDRSEDPTKPRATELVVRQHPHSVLAESYRQAFASLNKSIEHAGYQAVVLMGGLPGAGTTTVATNLGATWSAAGRRVVLVDANFRRPRLAQAVGVEEEGPGLGDVLAGAATAEEAVREVSDGLHIMPVGTTANRVFELLNTRRFDALLAELRDSYDLILFDTPPAVVAGESMVLASKADAAVLVIRAGKEQRGLVSRLVHQLSDSRCDLLGILLNRPRGTAGGYFKKNFATMAAYSAEQK